MENERYDSWALPVLSAWPKVLQVVNGGIPVPEVVEIFPTNFCNFQCPHCRFKHHHGGAGAFMDKTLFRRLLKDVKERGVENVELSGGGEPLAHPDIHGLFDCIGRLGFRVGLITNGYQFVGSEALQEQAARCCNWIRFSVDGFSEETYRRVHGRADIRYGDIKEAVTQIRRLANGTPKIGLKTLVSKLNAEDALLAIAQSQEIGADYLQLKFLGDPPELALSEPEVERVLEQVRARADSMDSAALHVEVLPPYRGPKGADKCLMTFLHPVVDWDGAVYVCAFFEHRKSRHSIGSVRASRFFEVWESEHHKAVFDGIDPGACVANCPMRRYNSLVDFVVREAYRRGFV
jgi:MoaA/NifB/PqqE/SkfB family radical SAM enzyme